MKRVRSFLLLSVFALSCNPASIGGETDCPDGETNCLSDDPSKHPPGGPGAYDKVGPGTQTPFDPSDDGSSGVKVDKDGNIVGAGPVASITQNHIARQIVALYRDTLRIT